jgi:hypothetical protein
MRRNSPGISAAPDRQIATVSYRLRIVNGSAESEVAHAAGFRRPAESLRCLQVCAPSNSSISFTVGSFSQAGNGSRGGGTQEAPGRWVGWIQLEQSAPRNKHPCREIFPQESGWPRPTDLRTVPGLRFRPDGARRAGTRAGMSVTTPVGQLAGPDATPFPPSPSPGDAPQ